MKLLLLVPMVGLLALLVRGQLGLPTDPRRWLRFVAGIVMAAGITFSLDIIIACLAFWIVDVTGIDRFRGLLARVFWLGAPRWFYTPVYVALGWVAVWQMPTFWDATPQGQAIVWLVAAGGLAYTIGAVVYGTKRPNPSPRWFGFHEVFHSLTVIGFVCHYIAVSIAVYNA